MADSVHGTGELEMLLRRAGKGCVLGVNAARPCNAWIDKPEVAGTAERIAHDLAPCNDASDLISWSLRRHAHQAGAQRSYLSPKHNCNARAGRKNPCSYDKDLYQARPAHFLAAVQLAGATIRLN